MLKNKSNKKLMIPILAMVLVVAMAGNALAGSIYSPGGLYSGDNYANGGWGGAFYDAYERSSYRERNVVVQRVLEQSGYSVTVDGYFGSGTKAKVEDFQSDVNSYYGQSILSVDGYVGDNTWAFLQNQTIYGGTYNSSYMYKVQYKSTWYFRHNSYGWYSLHSDGLWYTVS